VVTSTANNLIRELANYMALMHSLRPIAYDIFVGLEHLFEFYVRLRQRRERLCVGIDVMVTAVQRAAVHGRRAA
jgi:hypothetical protein